MTEKPTIPSDEALAALDDAALLQLLEDCGIDHTQITDTAGAIAALKVARDAPEDDQNKPATEPVDPPPPPEEPPLVLDTTAQDQPHTDYVREPRKTFGQVLSAETAAAFKSGDMTLHASIHNFEMAAGDFKRAAVLLVEKLPQDSQMRDVLTSIISDL